MQPPEEVAATLQLKFRGPGGEGNVYWPKRAIPFISGGQRRPPALGSGLARTVTGRAVMRVCEGSEAGFGCCQ